MHNGWLAYRVVNQKRGFYIIIFKLWIKSCPSMRYNYVLVMKIGYQANHNPHKIFLMSKTKICMIF